MRETITFQCEHGTLKYRLPTIFEAPYLAYKMELAKEMSTDDAVLLNNSMLYISRLVENMGMLFSDIKIKDPNSGVLISSYDELMDCLDMSAPIYEIAGRIFEAINKGSKKKVELEMQSSLETKECPLPPSEMILEK